MSGVRTRSGLSGHSGCSVSCGCGTSHGFDVSVEPESSDFWQRLENQLTVFAGIVQQMAQHQMVAIVALAPPLVQVFGEVSDPPVVLASLDIVLLSRPWLSKLCCGCYYWRFPDYSYWDAYEVSNLVVLDGRILTTLSKY